MWKELVADEADHPDFDYIFQTRTGNSIRKTAPHAFPAPNPNFHQNFDPEKDTKELEANLVLDRDLSVYLRNRVHAFMREHWDVFREAGVTIPVQGYDMVIDTGDFKPIAVRKLHYDLHESLYYAKNHQQTPLTRFHQTRYHISLGFSHQACPKTASGISYRY
jgi:hypothetical protein